MDHVKDLSVYFFIFSLVAPPQRDKNHSVKIAERTDEQLFRWVGIETRNQLLEIILTHFDGLALRFGGRRKQERHMIIGSQMPMLINSIEN